MFVEMLKHFKIGYKDHCNLISRGACYIFQDTSFLSQRIKASGIIVTVSSMKLPSFFGEHLKLYHRV